LGAAAWSDPTKWSILHVGLRTLLDGKTARKRHKPEEIVATLRQVDVLTEQGQSIAEA
jgi:hypothetical protein